MPCARLQQLQMQTLKLLCNILICVHLFSLAVLLLKLVYDACKYTVSCFTACTSFHTRFSPQPLSSVANNTLKTIANIMLQELDAAKLLSEKVCFPKQCIFPCMAPLISKTDTLRERRILVATPSFLCPTKFLCRNILQRS